MATPDLNPYLNRRPILNPREFHGRHSIVSELLQRLIMSDEPQSCLVLGMRRIGKSSLLHYLQDPQGARARHPETVLPRVKSLFVSLDAAQFTPLDESDSDAIERQTLRAMAIRLIRAEGSKEVLAPLPAEPGRDSSVEELADTLDGMLERLFDKGYRTLFLFDSIGPEIPAWPESLANRLRFYFNRYRVGYVMASLHPLTEVLEAGAASDLFNVFITSFLGPLARRSAEHLLQEPLGDPLHEPWEASFVNELLDELGTHPDLVKMAGARAWDLRRSTGQQPELEALLNALQPDIETLFRSIYRSLSDIQRSSLRSPDADLSALQLASPNAVKYGAAMGRRFADWMRRAPTVQSVPALDGNRLLLEGKSIELTPVEQQLLERLMASYGQAVERRQLQAEIWGDLPAESKALDTTIQRLRSKLDDDKRDPRWIVTVRGVGYAFGQQPIPR